MMKQLATGFLAVAAAGALALSMPATANASTTSTTTASSSGWDYSDSWGSIYSKHHLAKAKGFIGVEWNHDQDENSVYVSGKLYDQDHRTYKQGGKCAFVKFQVSYLDDEHDWDNVYYAKFCGAGDYKKFHFSEDDVYSVRAKVCQVGRYDTHAKKCGSWDYLYTVEGE